MCVDRLPFRRGLWPACLIVAATGCTPAPEAPQADADPDTLRVGPLAVVCYKDDEVVFEHPAIFRVYRPSGDDVGWTYETRDGLKFRGRIGENVNCVWD